MVGVATIFTFLQYIINPGGCITCLNGFKYIITLVFFFTSRFFISMFANFFVNVQNETFPIQVKIICGGAALGFARLLTLTIPYIPKFTQFLNIPFSLFLTFVGLITIFACFLLRETLDTVLPEMVE